MTASPPAIAPPGITFPARSEETCRSTPLPAPERTHWPVARRPGSRQVSGELAALIGRWAREAA